MARYDEMESRWLLPTFMRADAFDNAMAAIVDEYGADMSAATRAYSVWNAIDNMGEADIDALADELNILWYDKTADIEAKRGVVKNCKKIQAKLGTKWSLERIMETYFPGNTVIIEWFEYGGVPNHFRIETEYLDGISEGSAKFLQILNKVKRKSAILDKVVAVIGNDSQVEIAAWPQERHIEHMRARR